MTTPTLITLHRFSFTDGNAPSGSLVFDAVGDMFGVTAYGPQTSGNLGRNGTVFEIAAGTGAFSTLHGFQANATDGASPNGRLLLDGSGNLLGETASAGSLSPFGGTVFQLNPSSGTLTSLHDFNSTDGADPSGGLVSDSTGNLYGVTRSGGTYGRGTVFELDAATHAESILYSFQYAGGSGSDPVAALHIDSAGNLFGTTIGGSGIAGTIFEIDAATRGFSVLHSFTGADGAEPFSGQLVADGSGNLYGTTLGGGQFGAGTVFELAAGTHALTTLHSFNGSDGSSPFGGVIIDALGNLFGTTSGGGTQNAGTVFRLEAGSHAITVLHNFAYSEGGQPQTGLTVGPDGNLYGTTAGTDPNYRVGGNFGTVFELTNSGFGSTAFDIPVTITAPSAGGTYYSDQIPIIGTGEAGSTVMLSDGGALLGTGTVDSHGQWRVPVRLSGPGVHTVSAQDTDAAGNSGVSSAISFTLVSIGLTSAGGLTNQTHPTITGLTAPSFANTPVTLFDGTRKIATATVAADGSFSATVTLSGQGGHSITAAHTDAARTTLTSAAVLYTLDSIAPTVAITAVAGLTNRATQTVAGTGEAGTTVKLYDNGVLGGTGVVAANGTWSVAMTLIGDKTHKLIAKDTDTAGNTGSSAAVALVLDTTPPVVTLSGVGKLTNKSVQTIAGHVSDAHNGSSVTILDNGAVVATATLNSAGNFSTTIKLSGDGLHSITAMSTDRVGNSGTSAALVDTLDTHAPIVTITTAAATTRQAAQTITGTGEAGSAISLYDNGHLLGTTTVELNGSWSYGAILAAGNNRLQAKDTDAAGNVGSSAVVVEKLLVSAVTSVTFTGFPVRGESPAGTYVGHILATDTDPSATFTFAVTGGTHAANFTVDTYGNLVTAAPLHYVLGTQDVEVTATDNFGMSRAQNLSVVVNDAFAPSNVSLASNWSLNANSGAGASAGAVLATDGDVGDHFTYSIVGGTDAALFTLSTFGELRLTAQAGFNHGVNRDVIVKVTDVGGLSATQDLKIHVPGAAPADLAVDNTVIADGTAAGTTVANLAAIGLDPTDAAAFSIVGGASANQFSVSGNHLVLNTGVTFASTGGDMNIVVRATELDGAFVDKPIYLTVAHPTSTGGGTGISYIHLDNYTVRDFMPLQEFVGNLAATDGSGLPVNFSIVGGADAGYFSIANGKLLTNVIFNGTQDASVTVQATDSAGHSATQDLLVRVVHQNPIYGSGYVDSSASTAPNLFGSDGDLLHITGFNETQGDTLSSLLLYGDQSYVTTDWFRVVGDDASHIEVQAFDGAGTWLPVFDLDNAISKDGILQGHAAPITQPQLDTVLAHWIAGHTLHN